MANLDALADAVVLTMKGALTPVLERLAAAETRLAALGALDGRLTTLEAVRERVAALEALEPPAGPPGPPGPAGRDGLDGKDGTPGLRYCGVYADGRGYALGDIVTWAGSMWHCHDATTTKPGDGSPAWTLMVKRGRDGKGTS
jgi:hypothetical protein